MSDTIFALSSGALPSGVAVVRLSGPEAFLACEALSGPLPAPRTAALRTIRFRDGAFLDQGLVLVFPAPYSFTGEDCAELHIHGGRAVVASLLTELGQIAGLRHAEAGEFSRRAFQNGKLDLVQIEGLADLIAAETEMQRRLASEQMAGSLSALYSGWAERLTRARALIEAELDFPDEDDVPGSVADTVWIDMRTLAGEMAAHLANSRWGEIIRDGLTVVISGPPNSGKSTLMNALAKRDVAIVTDIPGTTRDILQVDLDMDGFAVKVYDTAGLRATEDPIEKIGVKRAHELLKSADITLKLNRIDLDPDTKQNAVRGRVVSVGTQIDRFPSAAVTDHYDVAISALTGDGMDTLTALITSEMKASVSSGSSLATRARHQEQLRVSQLNLNAAIEDDTLPLDLRAEHLRSAATALGRITGKVDVEHLLGIIFSEFCIGK